MNLLRIGSCVLTSDQPDYPNLHLHSNLCRQNLPGRRGENVLYLVRPRSVSADFGGVYEEKEGV